MYIQGIFYKECFEIALNRIHYQWGSDKMLLKRLEKIAKIGLVKRSLHKEKLVEITDWLHHLELFAIKVMMFAIGVHHLYVYTIKTLF